MTDMRDDDAVERPATSLWVLGDGRTSRNKTAAAVFSSVMPLLAKPAHRA